MYFPLTLQSAVHSLRFTLTEFRCNYKLKTQVNSWKKRVANLTRELEDVKTDLNK